MQSCVYTALEQAPSYDVVNTINALIQFVFQLVSLQRLLLNYNLLQGQLNAYPLTGKTCSTHHEIEKLHLFLLVHQPKLFHICLITPWCMRNRKTRKIIPKH